MFFCGALTGAVVATVVGVHAVGDVRKAELSAEILHAFEKFGLAVEAAIGIIALVLGIFEFFGLDDAQGNAVRLCKGLGLLHVAAGETWRVGEDGEHAVAEDAVGYGGQEGRIDSARVGNHQRAERAQAIFKRVQFRGCW